MKDQTSSEMFDNNPENNSDKLLDEFNTNEKILKKKLLMRYLIIGIIAALIIAAIIIIIVVKNNKDKDKNEDTEDNEEEENTGDKEEEKEEEEKTIIIDCDPGYYFPIDGDKCTKCSIENCLECSGKIGNDICINCDPSFYTNFKDGVINSCDPFCKENEKCLKCDTSTNHCIKCSNISYIIAKEKCILASFIATYITVSENEKINLINEKYKNYIIGMKIEDDHVEPSYYYTFPSLGNHTVYMS